MKRLLRLIPFALIFSVSIAAFGYEVETHEEMSAHAAQRSVLTQGVLSGIGLTGTLDTVVLSDGSINSTVLEWIRYGANHEDDFYYINHFYNPLNGQGYSFLFITGFPSPLWGLEPTAIDEQNYSLIDARDYFYKGLTLPATAGRERNLALTFQTLGHVIHLIQDAAQPQHTRNDSHGLGSLYESFTNESRLGLPYGGYPSDTTSVKFNTAVSFWHTLPPQINILAGQGIAEYSNRSFVTTGTNFRPDGSNVITDPNFPSPAYDPETGFSTDIATMMVTMPTCSVVTNLQGQLTFYGNIINDSYMNTVDFNQYATTLSLFDADLQNIIPGERFFSLNRFNFCAAQDRLIRRAVGYSAGLIDYFFRGKLEANYTEALGQLTVTAKNISGPENSLTNGVFELYYDAIDNTRKSLSIINGANVGSTGIVDGGSWVITANRPSDVDTGKQNPYILVYRGDIGAENGILGKVVLKASKSLYVGGRQGLYKFTTDGALVFGPLNDSNNNYGDLTAVAIAGGYIYAAGQQGLYKFTTDGALVFGPLWDGNFFDSYTAITIAGGYIYAAGQQGLYKFTTDGALVFGPLWGGDFFNGYTAIAIDGGYIYAAGQQGLCKFTTDGALVFGPLWDSGYFNAIAIDGGYIYVAGQEWLYKFTTNGAWVFGPGYLHSLYAIAIDGGYIYVGGERGLYKFTMDGALVFWLNDNNNFGYLNTITIDGGYIYAAGQEGLYKFTTDGALIFWLNDNNNFSFLNAIAIE